MLVPNSEPSLLCVQPQLPCGTGALASPSPAPAHLADRLREDLDDLLMGCCHHTLPIDLNDAVPHADATSLCDAPTHQTADLGSREHW